MSREALPRCRTPLASVWIGPKRRHHLALGTVLLQGLFEVKQFVRVDRMRTVRITHRGQEQLSRLLGVKFDA
jgi:hypothetical protein